MTVLNESVLVMRQDETYRRQGRHIIIAQMESLVPMHTTFEPAIWGGGSSDYTWKKVQQFYARSPLARNGQAPCHFYAEYLNDDYVMYVGSPITNKSWFLQKAVAAGVLPPVYMDAVLIVIQENYSVENVDSRLWRMMANNLITPLMRMLEVPKERVVFFENIANREAVNGPDWPFRWRDPVFLDPIILQMQIKDFIKS